MPRGRLRTLSALARVDALSVRRDPLLRWLAAYPLLLGGLVRWGWPVLADALRSRYGLDPEVYRPLVGGFLLSSLPMLAGLVVGFLLLDQRDDRTLEAILVSPPGVGAYLAGRLALPMAVGALLTLAVLPLSGFGMGPGALVLAAAAAAPLAPFYSLLLGAFAANKVQGFAVSKASGLLLAMPVAAFLVREPWQWLFGVFPVYWPAKLWWMLEAGGEGVPAVVAAGLSVQAAAVAWLWRRFRARRT